MRTSHWKIRQRLFTFAFLVNFAVTSASAMRVSEGLQVLYDFSSSNGTFVEDRSGVGEPLDLRISNPGAVRRSRGALEIRSNTAIHSDKPATKIIKAVRASGGITIEAWLRAGNASQKGPARIITLSRGHQRPEFHARTRRGPIRRALSNNHNERQRNSVSEFAGRERHYKIDARGLYPKQRGAGAHLHQWQTNC